MLLREFGRAFRADGLACPNACFPHVDSNEFAAANNNEVAVF